MATETNIVGMPRVKRIQWTDDDPSSATFGQVVHPTTAFVYRGPGRAEQTAAVSGPDAQGWYTARYTPDASGAWWFGWVASGSYTGYVEGVDTILARRA